MPTDLAPATRRPGRHRLGCHRLGRHRLGRALLALVVAATVALPATPAHAQDDDELETPDARYEGYAGTTNVALEPGSTAVTYLLFAGLAVLAVGVMFKDAKRSHLD